MGTGIMKNKTIILIVVIILLSLTLSACGAPGYVKDGIEQNSPGAAIVSAKKGTVPEGEQLKEVWCVVTEKNGMKTRWFITDSELMVGIYQGASQADFEKFGCENWDG